MVACNHDAVGPDGMVIGIDNDSVMIQQAQHRSAGYGRIEVRTGDAHALPLADASIDRARADRVLQHLADPPRALAELRRVLRPNGLVALAEPDWDTLVIDDPDVITSRAYTRFVATEVVRNATIGRQLGRLLGEAGFAVRSLVGTAVVFHHFQDAEAILRLRSVAERAWAAEAMDEQAARAWLDRLASCHFLASFTFFMAIGRARMAHR